MEVSSEGQNCGSVQPKCRILTINRLNTSRHAPINHLLPVVDAKVCELCVTLPTVDSVVCGSSSTVDTFVCELDVTSSPQVWKKPMRVRKPVDNWDL